MNVSSSQHHHCWNHEWLSFKGKIWKHWTQSERIVGRREIEQLIVGELPSQKTVQSGYCFSMRVSSDNPEVVNPKWAVWENTYVETFTVAAVLSLTLLTSSSSSQLKPQDSYSWLFGWVPLSCRTLWNHKHIFPSDKEMPPGHEFWLLPHPSALTFFPYRFPSFSTCMHLETA